MSVASKLTKSVRQAKASAAKQNDGTGPDASDAQASQEGKAAADAAHETKQPGAGRKAEPEPPVVPFPTRRVWPD